MDFEGLKQAVADAAMTTQGEVGEGAGHDEYLPVLEKNFMANGLTVMKGPEITLNSTCDSQPDFMVATGDGNFKMVVDIKAKADLEALDIQMARGFQEASGEPESCLINFGNKFGPTVRFESSVP